jgi:long-chain acyl-CoA synthetase
MVGRGLAGLLLQKTSARIYLLVHQSGGNLRKADVLEHMLSLPASDEYSSRLTILHGDITQPALGLEAAGRRELTGRVTHILHAAAATRFDMPLEQARLINVTGTENVARLALEMGSLQQFGFLSTVYVSGNRTGIIEEAPPDPGVGFINTYEQSKCEAEIALWRFAEDIPLAVYRLSTVVGDSRTGYVSHFTAPHQALRIMYLGLGAMCPGKPEYPVDLISSDYSAASVFELFWKHFVANHSYHIAHGQGSYSLQEVIETNYQQLARGDAEWASRAYPLPAIVSPDAFDLFMETALSARNTQMLATLRALDRFAREFVYPKQFDRSNTLAALPAYERQLPDIREYYPKVIQYCLMTKWRKEHLDG